MDLNKRKDLFPFMTMMRHHWPSMMLGGFLSLIAVLAATGLLSLSGWFIASASYAGLNVTTAKAFNFFIPSIGVRLLAMMRTGARYGERVISHDATFRILATLRVWSYTRIEPLAPGRLAKHHTGDLLTRIITDIDTLDNLYLRVISPTVVAAATMIILVGFVGYYSANMALYNGILLLISGLGLPILADINGRSSARQLNVHTGRMRTTLVDGIHGLAALLAFGAQTRHLDRFDQRDLALVRCQQHMSRITGLFNALTGLFSGLAVVGTLYIGVDLVAEHHLSVPLLVLLVLAVMAGFEVVVPLSSAYQYLGQTRKAADRLHNIVNKHPAVIFPSQTVQFPRNTRIDFDNVSFQYSHEGPFALKNIKFSIPTGQHVAVMGATGSGKSTLLYLLSRFEDPSSGKISMGGQLLETYSEESLRKQICIVDQKAHIFNGTLRDNLLIGNPQADTDALHKALLMVELMDFVKGLPQGLETWVGESGRLLSGGQARRLAIARATLSNAQILAFDEPTEGLDRVTASVMMKNLIQLAKKRTLIIITHLPEAVEQMDQVIFLKTGMVEAVDTPTNLKIQKKKLDKNN